MVRLQEPQDEKRFMRKHLVLLVVIVLPLIVAAVLWILSIQGVIAGPWPSLFSAIFTVVGAVFTVVGVVIALLQWSRPSTIAMSLDSLSPLAFRGRMLAGNREDINLGLNKRKGALIVKVRRRLIGASVNLYHGFDKGDDADVDIASSVVLRKIDGVSTFVSIFPALEPGKYTVSVPSAGYRANVTIQSGQCFEIDWQYTNGKS